MTFGEVEDRLRDQYAGRKSEALDIAVECIEVVSNLKAVLAALSSNREDIPAGELYTHGYNEGVLACINSVDELLEAHNLSELQ